MSKIKFIDKNEAKINLKWLVLGVIIIGLILTAAWCNVPGWIEWIKFRKKGVPEPTEWLIKMSEVISYVEVLEVDRKITGSTEPLSPGRYPVFPKQHAKVKFLKVLKGAKELENTISSVIKEKAHFYLTEKEKLVLYLEKSLLGSYHTIGIFRGEWRLASALSEINNLKESKGSGIVIGILNKENLEDLEVYVLQGRHKAPLIWGSKIWKDNVIKREKIGEFDIAEVSLKPGTYTLLIQFNGNLHSFGRLVNGYYPYVILEENDWRALYFDMKEIK